MSDENAETLTLDSMEGIDGYLDLLAEISQDFARSKNIDLTLERSLLRIKSYLNAEAASVFLIEPEEQSLVCHFSIGPEDITGARLKYGEGIVGQSIVKDTCLMVADAENEQNFSPSIDDQSGFRTKSILCSPLSTKTEQFGAIELINKENSDGHFDERDRKILKALTSSAAMAINNSRMTQALLEQERLHRELELAAELQSSLLPSPRESDFPIHAVNQPARMVSGDFFDYLELPDGRIIFNIGDVAGKGINAALLMAKTASLFRCLGKTIHKPGHLLGAINQEICETSSRGMFITMIVGILDPLKGTLTIANAGHEPPLLRTREGEYLSFPALAPPVGIATDVSPNGIFPEANISLENGTLYIFTDGVTEGIVGAKPLGIDGFKDMLDSITDRSPTDRLNYLVDIFHKSEMPLHDDLTLMLIQQQDGEHRK